MLASLSSEQIGEVGEAEFLRLCALAGLVANKSKRDLNGWDFIVEFPMPAPSYTNPLDRRIPSTCRVQLKTSTRHGPVSLRLSSAERLAKALEPSCIVVFRLSPRGDNLTGHLVHLTGTALEKVLRRLREAHCRGQLDVNHAFITFDYLKEGTRFDLTADGLRSALEGISTRDPVSYQIEKQRLLNELGYEDGGLFGEALITVDGPEHLGRILLGLEPLRPKAFQAFEKRFGIVLPYDGPAFADLKELRIEPPHIGSCSVSIKSKKKPAAIFSADMYYNPTVPEDMPHLLLRHPDFVIAVKSEGLNFETVGDFAETPRSLSAWRPLLRGLCYLSKGDSSINLTLNFDQPVSLSVPAPDIIDGPYTDELPDLLALLDGWAKIIDQAGLISTAAFTMREIWGSVDTVGLAIDLMVRNRPTSWIAFDRAALEYDTDPIEAVFINICSFAGCAVNYAVKLDMAVNSEKPGEYHTVGFKPLDVRPAMTSLDAYVEQLIEKHGIRIIIRPENLVMIRREDMKLQG